MEWGRGVGGDRGAEQSKEMKIIAFNAAEADHVHDDERKRNA